MFLDSGLHVADDTEAPAARDGDGAALLAAAEGRCISDQEYQIVGVV